MRRSISAYSPIVHATDILGKSFHLKQGKIRSDFIGGTLCLSDDLIDMEGFAGKEREEGCFVFRKRRERPFIRRVIGSDQGCRRRKFLEDVFEAGDEFCAVLNESMATDGTRREKRPGNGEDVPIVFESQAGGDERAASFRRFDDQGGRTYAGHDAIARREGMDRRPRSWSEFGDDRSALFDDLVGEREMGLRRNGCVIDTASDDGEGRTVVVECRLMSETINTESETGNDHESCP